MLPDSKLLVTGGTGFLGAYLIRQLLAKGYAVRATRRANSPMDLVADIADQVEWVDADVTDVVALEDAMTGITEVLHCAAMVSFHPRDVARMMQVNVEGTANVANLALEMGVRKMIHVSSIASLGRAKDRPTLDEDSKWVQSRGNSNYAISKYLSEQEVWRAHHEGLAVAIVNPAIIFGSGFWNLGSAKFFTQVEGGLKFCPTGSTGFVDVRDVARFMVHLLEGPQNGERYILNSENASFRRLFDLIGASIDKKPPFIPVSPLLAEVAWRVEWLKEKILGAEPMVTREAARSSVSKYFYTSDKSKTVFDFTYRSLETTIRETGAQFLEAKREGFRAMVLEGM